MPPKIMYCAFCKMPFVRREYWKWHEFHCPKQPKENSREPARRVTPHNPLSRIDMEPDELELVELLDDLED